MQTVTLSPFDRKYLLEERNALQKLADLYCSAPGNKLRLPVSLAVDLLEMADHHSFSGVLVWSNKNLVGYSWGRLYNREKMAQKLGDFSHVLNYLNRSAFFFYCLEEVYLSPDCTQGAIVKQLVKKILLKPHCSFPNVGGIAFPISTDMMSLFEVLGYVQIAGQLNETQKVVMGISNMRNLRVFA